MLPKVRNHNMGTISKVERMGRLKEVEKMERIREVEKAIKKTK